MDSFWENQKEGKKMAKFCQYCGRQVPEGMMCNCPEAAASRAAAQQAGGSQAGAAARQAASQAAGQFKQLAGTGFQVFSDLLKTPASTLHGCRKPESMSTGLMAYILKAVVAGLMFAIGMASMPYTDIDFGTWMQMFFKMLLLSIVADAVFFGVTYGIGKLFKNEVDPSSMLGVLGIASFPTTLTSVAAGLLSVLSLQLGLIVMMGLLCLCLVITYFALDSVLRVPPDKKVYAMTVVLIGVMLAMWLGNRLLFNGRMYF